MTLGDLKVGASAIVSRVGGERSFRRRMMELGLLPGTSVEVVRVAPLGDPIELRIRGCSLSIRREDSMSIGVVTEQSAPRQADATEQFAPLGSGLSASP